MAYFRGDGVALLDQAIRETDLRRKVELMENGLILHFRELEQVLQDLGPENFSRQGLSEIREGIACTE